MMATPVTVDDICNGGICEGINLCDDVICEDDGNECTAESCDPVDGTCSSTPVPDDTICNDGDPDTTGDVCTAGICEGVNLCEGVTCQDDGNECTIEECNPIDGSCGSTLQPDGTVCDDGDPITTGDVCTAGVCEGVNLCDGVNCDDGNACTVDACDPIDGSCSNAPEPDGTVCDDGDPNTTGDVCNAGICEGEPAGGPDCPCVGGLAGFDGYATANTCSASPSEATAPNSIDLTLNGFPLLGCLDQRWCQQPRTVLRHRCRKPRRGFPGPDVDPGGAGLHRAAEVSVPVRPGRLRLELIQAEKPCRRHGFSQHRPIGR